MKDPSNRRPGMSGAKGADAGEHFGRHIEGPPAASAPPAAAAPDALSAVLSVQEVVDDAERRRAFARGHESLDELHGLRLAIIDGWLPEGSLRRLASLVEQTRPEIDDARLGGVLDEIDLRAAIEMAKLRRPGS